MEIGYIDQEIDDWFHGRNEEYVRSLEANLEKALNEQDTESSFLTDTILMLDRSTGSFHCISMES
jgi:DNA replication initiation complex subunit (GINS family)